jgi:hypothetical protein
MEGFFSDLFLDVPYINNCVPNFFFDVIQHQVDVFEDYSKTPFLLRHIYMEFCVPSFFEEFLLRIPLRNLYSFTILTYSIEFLDWILICSLFVIWITYGRRYIRITLCDEGIHEKIDIMLKTLTILTY